MNDAPKDPIDAAIVSSRAVPMLEVPVTIASTGRPVKVVVPADMTDAELVEVAGWMLTALAGHFKAERAKTAGGRIVLPRGVMPS